MDDFLRRFRAAAPYLRRHRGATMVLCARVPAESAEGAARANFSQLLEDVAVLSGLGARAVLAYESEASEAESEAADAATAIDDESAASRQAAADAARRRIEGRLSMGMPDTPMSGAAARVSCGNLVAARPAGVVGGIDLRRRGRARRVAAAEIRARLDDGNIVLLPPFGYSPSGESFYLGAIEAATAAARALAADKLIFFASAGGGDAARQLTAREAGALAAEGKVESPLRELLSRAASACDGGVRRAHILDRGDPDALLLELFSRDGAGTMVSATPYDEARRARAEDAAAIFALTSAAGAALAPVDRARLESEIDDYRVVSRDGAILACARARVYAAEQKVELGGLTVRADYRGQGKGDMLFRMIESEARAAGMRALFLLTTQAEHWFVERGFAAASESILPSAFPADRRNYCDPGRRSKILAKRLDD